MNLHTLLTRIVHSDPADWHTIRGGKEYEARAILKPDIAIAIAWGLESGHAFHEPWATRFPDPRAALAYVMFSIGELGPS